MHKQEHCCDEAANTQLPIATAFRIIKIVSAEGCSNLTQNLMHIHCSTHSVILNEMATQYTCSLNHIYHSTDQCIKSSLFMHVHSSPLSSAARYISVMQSILIMLTMAGLFPDRTPPPPPHRHILAFLYLKVFILKLKRKDDFTKLITSFSLKPASISSKW